MVNPSTGLSATASLPRGAASGNRILPTVLTPAPAVKGYSGETLPKDSRGLRTALACLGVECRFNLRLMAHEWRTGVGDWYRTNDRVEARLQDSIAAQFKTGKEAKQPLRFGREVWDRSLNALLADAEVDPFLEWLENQYEKHEADLDKRMARIPLKLGRCLGCDFMMPKEGIVYCPSCGLMDTERVNGTYMLDTWLSDCFDCNQIDPLTAWVSRFLFLGAVERTYEPGAKLDEMPVLVGPQGCGKSTALRMMLPPEHPSWFADGLHLAADEKVRAEALQGRVLVESAEMAGSSRAELESLKAFLSRQDDGSVRLAYRRNPETMLRRCIIAGTTNNSECLPNDPTGNRRFAVVRVWAHPDGGVTRLRNVLTARRSYLWAEAVWLYRHGAEARLPDALAAHQGATNDEHRRRDDILEDQVAAWLGESTRDRFTMSEVAAGAGLVDTADGAVKLPMRDAKRLAAVLRGAGYDNKLIKTGRKPRRLWCR